MAHISKPKCWPKLKPPAFVMFVDLDGTFTPMDIPAMMEFISIVKEISTQCNVRVKFVPVSGRPAGYVLRVLHEVRDMLKGEGIEDVCNYGAAEQGAMIVDASRSYAAKFLGYEKNKGLKGKIHKILKSNKHHPIISDEPDKLYTCSIHVKNEFKRNMTPDQIMHVYESVRQDIWAQLEQEYLNISLSHNCMEVMSKEISKEYAMSKIIYRYMKSYDIVGMLMAGDAENDKIAINYMSRLAEIPGIPAHVFIPSNAQQAVESETLEAWKEKNNSCSQHRILKGHHRLFKGIVELIRGEIDKGTLVGSGLPVNYTRDDLALIKTDYSRGSE